MVWRYKLRKINNKRGVFEWDEILEYVVTFLVIVIIGFFILQFFSSGFNKQTQAQKSLLKSFKSSIEVADKGGVGKFMVYGSGVEEEDSAKLFLIYFGKKPDIAIGEEYVYRGIYPSEWGKFISIRKYSISVGEHKNYVCMCSLGKDKGECKACTSLDYPLIEAEDSYAILAENTIVTIKKADGRYEMEGMVA